MIPCATCKKGSRQSSARKGWPMKLSVIIPVYNEASTFPALLARVLSVPIDKEILVVDDASDQETVSQLQEAVQENGGNVRLFTHANNRGKGAAIRTALDHATGDAVIIQDADLEYFPEDYARLVELYQQNNARAVYGVRDLSDRSPFMRVGNHFLTWMTNLLFDARLRDMETCYKLVDRRLLQSLNLRSHRFEIEAEISSKLLQRGVHIYQTPIRYLPREEGKKLSPIDGLPTLATLIKYRLGLPEAVPIRQIERLMVTGTTVVVIVTVSLLWRLLREMDD